MKRPNESPNLIPRSIGGWIALSGDQDAVKIGVLADTEEQARAMFHAAREKWGALLEASNRTGAMAT